MPSFSRFYLVFARFYLVLPSFTEHCHFYLVVMGFVYLERAAQSCSLLNANFTGFYRVLLAITRFSSCVPGLDLFQSSSLKFFCSILATQVLPTFSRFYRVLPSFIEFYRVLPSFTEFYRVLPSFHEAVFRVDRIILRVLIEFNSVPTIDQHLVSRGGRRSAGGKSERLMDG